MAERGQVFSARYKLRFAHCDVAGIAFFPRLVEMINALVEDWFEEGLGVGFRALHQTLGRGVPAVALSVEFVGPACLGDVLVYSLSVAEIGRSSMTLDVRAKVDGGAPVLRARHKVVFADVSGDRPRPVAIEGELRDRIETYRSGEAHGQPGSS